MKEKKQSKKLTLNKERIANLNEKDMSDLLGGTAASGTCHTCDCETNQYTCTICTLLTTDKNG